MSLRHAVDVVLLTDDGGCIEGWAAPSDVSQPACTVRFEAPDGTVLTAACDLYREDLAGAGLRDGRCAFRLVLPPLLLEALRSGRLSFDGSAPISLDGVRIEHRRTAGFYLGLANADPGGRSIEALMTADEAPDGLRFSASLRDGGWIEGFRIGGGPVRIEAGGRKLWEGPAHRTAPGARSGPACRFVAPLPANLADGASITVTDVQTGAAANGSPLRYDAGARFRGAIDHAAAGQADQVLIAGWMADAARPHDWLSLALVADGRRLAETIANLPREDLAKAGVGVGRNGFRFSVPAAAVSGAAALAIVHPPSGVALKVAAAGFGGRPEEAPVEVPAAGDPEDPAGVLGHLDRADPVVFNGWARAQDRASADAPLHVELRLDGAPFALLPANRRRSDLAAAFSDDGGYAFQIEAPPHLDYGAPHTLTAQVRASRSGAPVWRQPVLAGGRAPTAFPAARPVAPPTVAPGERRRVTKAAMVIPNRNGAGLLAALFDSLLAHPPGVAFSLIVVDHASTDASVAVAESYADRLPVRVVRRDRNHSFSNACNVGAAAAEDADCLVFCNNDLTVCGDVIGALCAALGNASVGAAAAVLLDDPGGLEGDEFVQQAGVAFRGSAKRVIDPFEVRPTPGLATQGRPDGGRQWGAVSAACLAVPRAVFEAAGGFDEGYWYGSEDIDLSLAISLRLGLQTVSVDAARVRHARGLSRNRPDPNAARRLAVNHARLDARCGPAFRQALRRGLAETPVRWLARPLRIGLVVSETGPDAVAGDYFTALELARALAVAGDWDISFLAPAPDRPEARYEAADVDVLIVLLDGYDLRRIVDAPPWQVRIAWARNWIDRWRDAPWADRYDLWWASSAAAATELGEALGVEPLIMPIATAWERFHDASPSPDLEADYAFLGSFFDAPREIAYALDPDATPWRFALYGAGWEKVPHLAAHARGPLPYDQAASLYKSVRVVIDDANHVTAPWGSVNSRVFDAIAAGALPVTNGREGAQALFGDLAPTWTTPAELDACLAEALGDEPARRRRVQALQTLVRDQHTYAARATQARRSVEGFLRAGVRLAIKIGAPRGEVREAWGDFWFARGLARALRPLGFHVRIDCLEDWSRPEALGDDAVLVLRGLSAFTPQPHQVNLMWMISHPLKVAPGEVDLYDRVFVASATYAGALAGVATAPLEVLLQCCDERRFRPDGPAGSDRRALFVGNSRGVYRSIVREAVESGVDLEIHGGGWDAFLPPPLKAESENLPYGALSARYRAAACVLNDHWPDMQRLGFLSNRLFDAAACGARIVSDPVEGLDALFGDFVTCFDGRTPLAELVAGLAAEGPDRQAARDAFAEHIRAEHGFAARARRIADVVRERLDARIQGAPSPAAKD